MTEPLRALPSLCPCSKTTERGSLLSRVQKQRLRLWKVCCAWTQLRCHQIAIGSIYRSCVLATCLALDEGLPFQLLPKLCITESFMSILNYNTQISKVPDWLGGRFPCGRFSLGSVGLEVTFMIHYQNVSFFSSQLLDLQVALDSPQILKYLLCVYRQNTTVNHRLLLQLRDSLDAGTSK